MTNRWAKELRKRKPGKERAAFRVATDVAYARVKRKQAVEHEDEWGARERRYIVVQNLEKKLKRRFAGSAFDAVFEERPLRGNRYFQMALSVGG